jgi:hypothetical protein
MKDEKDIYRPYLIIILILLIVCIIICTFYVIDSLRLNRQVNKQGIKIEKLETIIYGAEHQIELLTPQTDSLKEKK